MVKYDESCGRLYTPFDTLDASVLVNKYICGSNDITDFTRMDNTWKGILVAIHEREYVPYQIEFFDGKRDFVSFISPYNPIHLYYLPFTIEKFEKLFKIGDIVHLRSNKNAPIYIEHNLMYLGNHKTDNIEQLNLGGTPYEVNHLLNMYEFLNKDNEWQPFGVKKA